MSQNQYKNTFNKDIYKQVRTNIGLADTLIPSSFLYLIYMGGTGSCDSIKIIFGYHINSQHIILNIKFAVNRMFHVVKTPIYRFDLYRRHRTLWTDDDNFWQCYLELVYKPKYQIWFDSDVPCIKTPVYRFNLYGRYRTMWTDDEIFWQCYLELAYKPKYQIWCESDVPCAQDPSIPI